MIKFIKYASIIVMLSMTTTAFAGTKKLSVQVRQGQLRTAPSYLSRVVTNLNYATRVVLIEEKGAWLKVSVNDGKTSGWMNKASLTKKRLKMKSGAADISNTVSTEEQALAGKGFNSDVEAEFKKENKDIDFVWVDKMEKIKVNHRTIAKFLKDGDIKSRKGAN
jgi:uncharacterized protein YgiM (DUF1202 family)